MGKIYFLSATEMVAMRGLGLQIRNNLLKQDFFFKDKMITNSKP
tara:strand:+ start:1654 stop:1785 length:132 start_codon:yes stop_codon:yes gene_type:complete